TCPALPRGSIPMILIRYFASIAATCVRSVARSISDTFMVKPLRTYTMNQGSVGRPFATPGGCELKPPAGGDRRSRRSTQRAAPPLRRHRAGAADPGLAPARRAGRARGGGRRGAIL